MQRPDTVGSVATKAETGTSLDTSPGQCSLSQGSLSQAGTITRHVSLADAAKEADHKQRARRQALLLMAASSILTVALVVGAWLALRRRF
jgi:hypothetical protein